MSLPVFFSCLVLRFFLLLCALLNKFLFFGVFVFAWLRPLFLNVFSHVCCCFLWFCCGFCGLRSSSWVCAGVVCACLFYMLSVVCPYCWCLLSYFAVCSAVLNIIVCLCVCGLRLHLFLLFRMYVFSFWVSIVCVVLCDLLCKVYSLGVCVCFCLCQCCGVCFCIVLMLGVACLFFCVTCGLSSSLLMCVFVCVCVTFFLIRSHI